MRLFFTFEFSNEDNDTVSMYRFDILGSEPILEAYYLNYAAFEDKAGNMEMYGVHDVSAHPGDLEGFTSYEIDPEDYEQVMDEWRTWFIEQGFECGDVYKVSTKSDGTEKKVTSEELARRDQTWDYLDIIRQRVIA